MHLSDEQLLEIDAVGELHLSQCKDCQQRADNLLSVRNKLNELPLKILPSDNWEKIRYTYQMRNDEVKHKQNEKRITRWKISAFALAASLILAVIFPRTLIMDREAENTDQQLTLLIEQNNLLQQQLINLRPEIVSESDSFNFLRSQFSVLDRSIQRAHIQKKSKKEKLELWQKRQELLKQWLTTKTPLNTISI